MSYVTIKPMGLVANNADKLLYPLMRVLMEMNGTPEEAPQSTHRWNNHRLSRAEAGALDRQKTAFVEGDPNARYLPSGLRHLPLIGWQEYVVLAPARLSRVWHVGWIETCGGVAGVSRLRLDGPVKLLRGPRGVHFFATNEAGRQVGIGVEGEGRLSFHRGQWSGLRLL
jgi:hypothetical protein